MTTRVERFLAHLDGLSGGVEPQFWPVESTSAGHHGVTAIGYRNMPEPGLLLGFTYGLSLARQEDWRLGRPELSISVRSDDPAWVLAIAHVAEQLRHDCPFSYADTINFGEPIAEGSGLDGFVVFGPLALGPEVPGSTSVMTCRSSWPACTRRTPSSASSSLNGDSRPSGGWTGIPTT